MLVTFGFTFATFVLGGVSWWVPTYVELGLKSINAPSDKYAIFHVFNI